ncbi:hypothetical protein BBO99_00003204 [Phytophthora kernoviae]|uniref:Uncharacterized protein n=2 Tax=Phytophthora kernoviae TaxID=325452 RepID=A0A3R7KW22_9STRA|nr:hypothetical protein G195_004802 [Phytophthora kernoviae 00238/432]KAG2525283.1 hypothetical protein JM16_003244 [Phytophthora kernoviae]KAG2526963.1 hypothetical protein JM18_003348 [Phytophthora kernoviae]RLN10938.1 hypothetical protein BBI17_000716 [Phytophthora kernoviae]RLN82032.1 hypothetical protein BBO99_00003204 [Phytophthora kernoviae]
MPRHEGGSAEISFETLTVDDIEVRERDVVEDGERFVVSYAAAIQGMETSRINYKDLRRACTYLGVRYYKNRNKDTMLELIAQMKLNGKVPESYRRAIKKHQRDDEEVEEDIEETKKQRVMTEGESSDTALALPSNTGRATKDRAEALNMLYHIRQQIREVEQHLAAHLLSDGVGINYEDKAKRLKEDLQFYLEERRALMQQLESTRSL